jgi:hypothetical protein
MGGMTPRICLNAVIVQAFIFCRYANRQYFFDSKSIFPSIKRGADKLSIEIDFRTVIPGGPIYPKSPKGQKKYTATLF